MLPTIVRVSLVMVLGLVTVITMRITVPTILLFDEQFYFKPTKIMVVRVYICLTAVIVLEMILIYLSVSLLYMTTDWIIALYIPLLIFTIYHTYKYCVVHLASRITDKVAKDFLINHWNRYIEHDDQFWIQIQLKMDQVLIWITCGGCTNRVMLVNMKKVC
ncbi:uncharacterized protein LOC117781322 isoform X2 [Drosophila innubila]|uniref:uncharacterized protein LOC117781322 isoform X2 n=1 Tax=Drosophila innubila TaxID=198719 RepID=UPI00148BE17E|nr:uncharacterized protein LOC117781322 isoform X2 [Drosophila innubila]